MKKVSDTVLRAYFMHRYPDEPMLIDLLMQSMHNRVETGTNYYSPVKVTSADQTTLFAHDWQYGADDNFAPTTHFEKVVEHLADWLRAAIATKQRWIEPDKELPNLGSQRLRYLDNVDAVIALADLDIKNFNDRMRGLVSLGQDEQVVMKFDNGYRVVELPSPLALDAEGAHMDNCAGLGGYDQKMALQTHRYYSLRDAQNKPHVTFEVHHDKSWEWNEKHVLVQVQGKANKPPSPEYMPYVRDFVAREKLVLGGEYRKGVRIQNSGLFEQSLKYYSVYDLPDDFCFWRDHSDGNLNLENLPVRRLPKNFSVRHYDSDTRFADLNISGTLIEHLPENMRVDGKCVVYLDGLKTIGKGLTVGKGLFINSRVLEGLPENLSVGGSCHVSGRVRSEWSDKRFIPNRPLAPLPAGLRIGCADKEVGGLTLEHFQNIEFPMDMQVHGQLTVRRCDRLVVPARLYDVRWMSIRDIGQVEMAAGITVTGDLIIEGKSPRTLPENLTVHGSLDISKSVITKLPASLKVDGEIKLPPHMMQAQEKSEKRGIKPQDIFAQREGGEASTQRS